MKYKLEDFDEFLLAEDNTVKDISWVMVYNSFNIKEMNLDELALLKLKISQKKYQSNISTYRYNIRYYSNDYKLNLIKSINKRLKRFSGRNKLNSFYRAQKIIRELNERNNNVCS